MNGVIPQPEPRPIDSDYLFQLRQWVNTAHLFTSSPEGSAFGREMQEVITLAQLGLAHRHCERNTS